MVVLETLVDDAQHNAFTRKRSGKLARAAHLVNIRCRTCFIQEGLIFARKCHAFHFGHRCELFDITQRHTCHDKLISDFRGRMTGSNDGICHSLCLSVVGAYRQTHDSGC